MKFPFSSTTVKKSISAHSSVGLIVGAFMYIICLTGTLLVFKDALERWQQPDVAEFHNIDGKATHNALKQYLSRVDEPAESIYIVFPTEQLPRSHVADTVNSWWTDAKGNISKPTAEGFAHLLEELHTHLHMPASIGIIIVSLIGVMLLSLIISGLVGHPGIIKQAFQLRLGGRSRIEQMDIHNRLSVWGLPFHIMIAVTGAFYGLVGLLVVIAASAKYDGDRNALFDDIYGKDPVLKQAAQKINFTNALANLSQLEPTATPIYTVVQNYGKQSQFIEIAATLPGRLAYSEIYRFYSDGRFLNNQGLTSGPAGRQFLYSLYRIHFGWFGGWGVRWLYFILGFALTVISVTGINIWLNKRAKDDHLDRSWAGLVWGMPLALVACAAASITLTAWISYLFFIVLLLIQIIVNTIKISLHRLRSVLILSLSISLIFLTVLHSMYFPFAKVVSSSWAVNLSLLVATLLLLSYRYIRNRSYA